jgi:hypothetical protein
VNVSLNEEEHVRLENVPASSAATAANGGETPHGSRFGELLVEEGLVTPDQLAEALRVQGTLNTYIPIGRILMMRGCLTRTQLTTMLGRHRKRARLGELLVRSKRITPEQLETALARQQRVRQPLGQILVELGYLTEVTMREGLCSQLHINFFDLDRIPLDRDLTRIVTAKYALRRRVVPLFRADRMLVVAVDNPTDLGVAEELQQHARLRIELVTSTTEKIQRAIARLYGDAPLVNPDPCLHPNIMIGAVHDQEIADLAAKILKVRILPPYWQAG